MSRVPRLLPIVAIAIGGVVALKAATSIEGVPQALAGARAWAEEAPKAAAKAIKPPVETPTVATEGVGQTPAPKPVAACAPSAAQLAKEAGLSPAELQVLQSLQARRGELDAREQEMDTQLQLLTAAEAKLETKLKALAGLKGEIQALMGQAEEKETAEVARLTTVYSKMKPRDAAAIMTQLDDKVRLPVAATMKEAGLAAILAQMPPAEAKKLTESLANRFEKARTQAMAASDAASKLAPDAATQAKQADPAKQAAAKPAAKPPAPKA